MTTFYIKAKEAKHIAEAEGISSMTKPITTTTLSTPWGPAQSSREIAPGIVFHSTGSHGGFHLSDARVAMMPKCLRDFVPFGGKQSGPGMWLEEDCDWSIAAIAFPQFFKPEDIDAALRTLKGYKPELYEQIIAAGIGQCGRGV